jgi:1-aminocyclopropane-1-carboxylate deaminase
VTVAPLDNPHPRIIDLVARGEIEPSSTVLYAHLGGQPAINGYSALFS